MCKNLRAILFAALTAAMLSGCGQVGRSGAEKNTDPIFTTTTTFTKRSVHTTKTAVLIGGEIDEEEEDLEGNHYTTTTSITGSLENESNELGEVDEELRATQRTEAKTYYTIPEHNGTTAGAVTVSGEAATTTAAGTIKLEDDSTTTKKKTAKVTETTTTAFKANALFPLENRLKYSADVAYTVTSDTTYLNLRFGPSKQYEVILKIPDGSSVTGYGETVGTDGNVWVYTSYNGSNGWVMRELLS